LCGGRAIRTEELPEIQQIMPPEVFVLNKGFAAFLNDVGALHPLRFEIEEWRPV
jgi:hypothetical protein